MVELDLHRLLPNRQRKSATTRSTLLSWEFEDNVKPKDENTTEFGPTSISQHVNHMTSSGQFDMAINRMMDPDGRGTADSLEL